MIYFYLIDKVTLMPELEGAMYNYFNCNQMIIGKFVRYAITFKTNQRSFSITRRQYTHDLLVQLNNKNLEHQIGIELPLTKAFLVTETDRILIYN